MNGLYQRLTYDPTRENITRQSQKVDAGTQAMGLHIENDSTPLPPDIIAFFSEKSASRGSQTTLEPIQNIFYAKVALKRLN